MGALADPLRMTVARKLLLESDEFDHPCGWFGFDRPKSSLTHHFKVLREAGGPLRLMEVHRRLNQRGWRVSMDSLAGALSRTPLIVRLSRGLYAARDDVADQIAAG